MNNLVATFESLSDENRLRILNLLIASPRLCVMDLERVLGLPQTRISRHLAYLRNRNMVTAHREGTWMVYELGGIFLQNPGLKQTLRSMFSGSEQYLSDIERLLEDLDENAVSALKDADPETVGQVIENCCNLA